MENNQSRDFKIEKYEPSEILKHFANISKIPRISGNHKQISEYLYKFFENNATSVKKDKANNIIVFKKATKGYEDKPSICLQAHYDMIHDVQKQYKHNPDTDPIKPFVKDGWLQAEGTTLGADNGIGVATIMAIFESNSIIHGPIWALLTNDEERGFKGALALEENQVDAKYLINIDSDGLEKIVIGNGCALAYRASTGVKHVDLSSSDLVYRFSLENLLGGHSGIEISKTRINAAVVISNFLKQISLEVPLNIVDIKIGNANNTIPSNGYVEIAINKKNQENFEHKLETMLNGLKLAFDDYEQNFDVEFWDVTQKHTKKISNEDTKRIINAMLLLPNGMVYYDKHYDRSLLSNNIGLVYVKDGKFIVEWATRALYEFNRDALSFRSLTAIELLGFETVEKLVELVNWHPVRGKLLNQFKTIIEIYLKRVVNEAVLVSQGLEVGPILRKNPSIVEAISIGPTIIEEHTHNEKMELESLKTLWKVIKELLICID